MLCLLVLLAQGSSSSLLHLYGQPETGQALHSSPPVMVSSQRLAKDALVSLKPGQVRERLGRMVEAMDRNQDERVTVTELEDWIRGRQEDQVRRVLSNQSEKYNNLFVKTVTLQNWS